MQNCRNVVVGLSLRDIRVLWVCDLVLVYTCPGINTCGITVKGLLGVLLCLVGTEGRCSCRSLEDGVIEVSCCNFWLSRKLICVQTPWWLSFGARWFLFRKCRAVPWNRLGYCSPECCCLGTVDVDTRGGHTCCVHCLLVLHHGVQNEIHRLYCCWTS